MIQGSKEWHQKRATGVGSSDAGVLLGFNQWRTVEDLWLEKTGQKKPDFKTNPAMERGTRLEPAVRADVELRLDLDFPDEVFTHPKYPFMLASLDGWNAKTRTILECKCPNEKAHRQASEGIVPDYYVPQIMHQLMVVGAEALVYASFDGFKVVTINVTPDLGYQYRLLQREIEFWNFVTKKERPPDDW